MVISMAIQAMENCHQVEHCLTARKLADLIWLAVGVGVGVSVGVGVTLAVFVFVAVIVFVFVFVRIAGDNLGSEPYLTKCQMLVHYAGMS
jgi:hypothetical protein